MSNKRITQLSSLTSASLDTRDLMVVVDRSFNETKQIDITNLIGYLKSNLVVTEAEHCLQSETAELATDAVNATSSSHAESSYSSTSSSYASNSNISSIGGNSSTPFYIKTYSQLERSNMTNIGRGAIIFNTDSSSLQYYNGNGWITL
jgi:hypothetical protein